MQDWKTTDHIARLGKRQHRAKNLSKQDRFSVTAFHPVLSFFQRCYLARHFPVLRFSLTPLGYRGGTSEHLNKGVDVKFRRTQLRCKLMNTFIRHNKQTLKDEKVKKNNEK